MAAQIVAILKRFWLPVVLVLGLAAFFWFGGYKSLTWETIAANYGDLKARVEDQFLLSAIAFMALYLVVVAFSLPIATPLTLIGGALFGWLGVILILFGATSGAAVVFLAARTVFADVARKRAGPFIAKLEKGFNENAFNYLMALRLIPAAPFWVVNIVPALTRMRFGLFLLATFVGIVPGTTVYVSVGISFNHILAAGDTPSLDVLREFQVWAPLVALGLLSLMPVAWKWIKGRR